MDCSLQLPGLMMKKMVKIFPIIILLVITEEKTGRCQLSAKIHGETMAIVELPDGRLLNVYRRMDKPGLWATISQIQNNKWINEKDYPLWGSQEMSLTNKSDNMVQDFNELKFGAPCITLLPDNTVYLAFWCYEKMVSNIRWFKLRVI